MAALVPAVQAARQNTATVPAGLVATGVSRRQPDSVWVFAPAVPVLFGLVVVTPWLIGRTGGVAARLRLPLRVAVRHRSRTATAVAMGIGAYSRYTDAAGMTTGVALSRPMTSHGPGDPTTLAVPWTFVIAVVAGLPVPGSPGGNITGRAVVT
ncbi:hypothetical protein [Spongiactinospora sp. 9N601]|uniref:hypothetical protein n=1 Tax=Spongiactinospora sp. 9N601 TaxID=3375149 RepID=UPI00378F1349